MTKAEIVTKISKQTGVDREKVLASVEAFMGIVKESITEGEDIFLRGFGTFTTKTRKQKIGRVITEKRSVIVPEHKIPYFKPCDEFKNLLAEK